jgi:glycosyltransferase involved in cell wall biosynthesis
MIKQGVSIIICCHNGANRLRETIKYIANQKVPSYINWEFILVDNCSTDSTAAVAKEVWEQFRSTGEFRVVEEPALGLSHARQKGFSEARYECMILCDDDNWLAKDYIAKAYEIMMENPKIGALGGYGSLVFEIAPPEWIRHSYIFAAGKQSPTHGKVARHRIYGAGAVIRKSAVKKLSELGFSSLLSDRKGLELSSGGDYELCYALVFAGYEVWYDDTLRFDHYITKERVTWDYFMRYARESSRCFDVLISYKLIAEESRTHRFFPLVMLKEFLYTMREFFRIGLKRLSQDRTTFEGKILYFRFLIQWYKLLAYFQKFNAIRKSHSQILKFREICRLSEARFNPVQESIAEVKTTYASKLSRQPQ